MPRFRRLPRYSMLTLLVVITVCAVGFWWIKRSYLQPTWKMAGKRNVHYVVRTDPWPCRQQTLEWVAFIPNTTLGRSVGTVIGGTKIELKIREGESVQHVVGSPDSSHFIWVPENGTFVPYPYERRVDLSTFKDYLRDVPGGSRTPASLVEYAEARAVAN